MTIRMQVAPDKGRWKVSRHGSDYRIFSHTQALAILEARQWAGSLVKAGNTVTLKIKRPNGEIRDERTYPRSSDPRRSKG